MTWQDKNDIEVHLNAMGLLWKWYLYYELSGGFEGSAAAIAQAQAPFVKRWQNLMARILAVQEQRKRVIVGYNFFDLLYLNGMVARRLFAASSADSLDAWMRSGLFAAGMHEAAQNVLSAMQKSYSTPTPPPAAGSPAFVNSKVCLPAAQAIASSYSTPLNTSAGAASTLLHPVIEPLAIKGYSPLFRC